MSSPQSVLVTGGCGFIGSHLVDALVSHGHRVRILDSLDPQAHEGRLPRFLNRQAELIPGDLRDRAAVGTALDGVDIVFHQAGVVGNGQSMYDIARYLDINVTGTAILMEEVVGRRDRVRRVVAASSMVVYGDGAYRCQDHGVVAPPPRDPADLAVRSFEPRCPHCRAVVDAVPTAEAHPVAPASPYAIGKLASEQTVLVAGRSFGVETVALRYLNVYGPRQALSNPYTGVAAIFATQLLAGRRPSVFEDGGQRRDLVHVSDVVNANLLAMESPAAAGLPVNVGTGESLTIAELATGLARELGIDVEAEITAVTDRATGLRDLATWVAGEQPIDRTQAATAELVARGLIR